MPFSVVHRPCVAILLPNSGNDKRNANARPNRLIIPGSRPSPSPVAKPLPPNEPLDGGTKRTYRPPMGYFVKTKEKKEVADIDAEVMIQRLSAGSGRWHELASFIPRLTVAGYDAYLIEELTGIAKGEQDILVTAASVLQSISLHAQNQNLTEFEATLEYFEIEGSHFALYELRFLDVADRVSCAQYVVRNELPAKETKDLARAAKEYYRREGEALGFECTPEDFLAYKFYRNALESREQDLIASFVEKGLKVAQSEAAKQKLESVLTGHEKMPGSEAVAAPVKIHIYRLLSQEIRFRPLPYAGELSTVQGAALKQCPVAKTSGEFGLFEIQDTEMSHHAWKWLALPNWPLFAHAKRPVALGIQNCAGMSVLRSSILAKRKEEALRLSGSGLLIVDVSQCDAQDPESYYLISAEPLELKTRADISEGDEVLAKVLFVCRPPDKDSEF